ncbi:MAG: dihydrofolate reductase [Candidatus Magasanikbacteria bacterium CG10_big_fil_rev_8_21_14_0_10_36_32]|uniref:Dihydrofolate reductase n=1 Tax=Candidatus Magasanikbacteria bacterium CG10_big_fil_rev_8_21_14_0_10_36_32 TaxID=1974646 RepID=A0A2M6W6U4_9BACT|nr:MAG: dihydrofolate reductase [Candidatus Magasanikbacteria bacterium CG10_big_fil_rev_8_21_14_0_10_36_32]
MKTILLMAITADGKIGKHSKHLADWTSKADKKIFVAETKKAGVIVMGQTTFDTIGKPLPNRLNVVMNLNPDKTKNILEQLEFTNSPPKKLLDELSERGFETVILGGGATINGLFLDAELIDEIWLTVEPKIFGSGLSLFNNVDVNLSLELISLEKIDTNVLQIRYRVIK